MPYKLSRRSLLNLTGVHPDLIKVVHKALEYSEIDFAVTEGLRTLERQAQLVKAGASRTMNSQHLIGRAVDLAPYVGGKIRWDWPLFYKLAAAMKAAANDCMVQITWGGDWKSFPDGPHFELKKE